jgi:CBS domain-containing protein
VKVKELMTSAVFQLPPSAALVEAARIMWDNDCGFVPITNPLTGAVMGVITDRDACMAALFSGRPLHDALVSDSMSRAVFSVGPEDDVNKAHLLMRRERVRRLPVVDAAAKLIGVLSLNDLSRHAMQHRGAGSDAERAAVAETLAAVCVPHEHEKSVAPSLAPPAKARVAATAGG